MIGGDGDGQPPVDEADVDGVLLACHLEIQCLGCGDVIGFDYQLDASDPEAAQTIPEFDIECPTCTANTQRDGHPIPRLIPAIIGVGTGYYALDNGLPVDESEDAGDGGPVVALAELPADADEDEILAVRDNDGEPPAA